MSAPGTKPERPPAPVPRATARGRIAAVVALSAGAATLMLWTGFRTVADVPRAPADTVVRAPAVQAPIASNPEPSPARPVAPATVVAQAAPQLAPVAQLAVAPKAADGPAVMTMDQFLDRLMIAESGGRDNAANPRSSAVGPFQFIEATWLDVMRRHFGDEVAAFTPAQRLALRTDRGVARRAAEAYTRDNAAHLQAQGLTATYPHLRLAFLLGPAGAARLLQAAPDTRVAAVVGPAVAKANPFMFGMTVKSLIERSARDIATDAGTADGVAAGARPLRRNQPAVAVQCNISLPSCRRWLAMAERQAAKGRRPAITSVNR